MNVKSKNITITTSSFENITLIQRGDSPVYPGVLNLEVFNFDDVADPKAVIDECSF